MSARRLTRHPIRERWSQSGLAAEGFDFGGGEGAVEDHEVVEEADVVDAEAEGGLGRVPGEGLGDGGGRSHQDSVQVKRRLSLCGAEGLVGDGDMGPLIGGEGGLLDDDQTVVEGGVFVGFEVGGVPGFEGAEDAETEVAGLVVLGEIDPDGGVVVGLVGELDGVAEAGGEVLVGVEAEPERDGSRLEIDVLGGVEEDGVGVLSFELEGSRAVAAGGGGVSDGGGRGEAGGGFRNVLIRGGGVELGIAFGLGGFVEAGVEEEPIGEGGESEEKNWGHVDSLTERCHNKFNG